MQIEVLYFDGCPHYLPTLDRLKTILRQEGLSTGISTIEVKNESDAKALRFFGSPTVRVNGVDIDADSRHIDDTGLACRRYAGGIPSDEMIRTAITDASAIEDA